LKDNPKRAKLSNAMEIDPALETKIPDRAPDCFRCRHFKITWDPSFPYSCRIFGFKGRGRLPSTEVFLSTGKHCFSFAARED
jgi:hypothetical protein